ncbi:hypothetical protein psyc5s11_12440 [Clostridium gelidum]|uniref:Iron-dependent peroxidase n=1 Tax=Clostridium gelidum TaxID=704125 RepID=A0ABM7T1U8_9CLOT|nr:hypothetical protein [Clostridium gelidum]BCZ45177.1 hypothetical protein psyc5s11_12440 [Clostridium gelidum]
MNYIWDMLLKADKQKIHRKNIKFVKAKICSPYMEIAFNELNATSLPEDNIVEINECYRFYEIFKDLFNINIEESRELREVLLDILLHYLAELDLKKGLCKAEFHKKFLMKDILNKVFGEELGRNINYFEKEERETFLNGLITLYKTGVSIQLFNKVLRKVFKNSIVYSNKEKPKNMYIYLGEVETKELKNKIDVILDTFLSIDMKPLIFWNQHFGILGLDNTMRNDEIVMVE